MSGRRGPGGSAGVVATAPASQSPLARSRQHAPTGLVVDTVWIDRLPDSAHTSRPWRIHEIARDFRLEDVWALPTPGGPDDFPRLVRTVGSLRTSGAARWLLALRWQIGKLLRLDRADSGLSARVPSLRDRLPDDLRAGPTGEVPPGSPFRPVYLTGDEWALEIA